jgi:hypothetical protein
MDEKYSIMNNFIHSIATRTSYQISSLVFTSLILLLIIYYNLVQFHACEVRESLIANLPQKGNQWGDESTHLNVGFVIEQFPKFNIREDAFEIKGSLWFKFNHNLISLDKLNTFSFENGKILQISAPKVRLISSQELFVYYDIHILFSSLLNHRLFPFTDHALFLNLKLDEFSSKEINVITGRNNLKVYKDISSEGWKLKDYNIEAGYIERSVSKFNSHEVINFPRVIFTFSFEKPGSRRIFIIFGPMLMIFFLALVSLLIHRTGSIPALNMAIGSLSALIVHRIIIESLSPVVGYFTLTDSLYLYFLGTIFLIILACVQDSETSSLRRNKMILYYGLQIMTIVVFVGIRKLLACS